MIVLTDGSKVTLTLRNLNMEIQMMKNADEVVAFQENISTAASLEEHMDKIIGALNRVEKGTYGKCIICDKDLPEDRLRALPSAENCTDCK